jgi:hypothetical protein
MHDVEELLKEGLDELTAGARVPAGMAARARLRHHRRRVTTRASAAVAGTAMAGAAGLFATAVAGPGVTAQAPAGAHGSTSHGGTTAQGGYVRTVAQVIGLTERAMSTRNLIMESVWSGAVYSLSGPAGHRKYTKLHAVGFSYRNLQYGKLFTGPAGFGEGQPAWGVIATRLASDRPGAVTQETSTRIFYASKTYSQTQQQVRNPKPPVELKCSLRHYLSRPLAPQKTWVSSSPASIRAALACGGLKITGRGQVDGVTVLKLAGTSRLTKYPLTVDVSPATYLPVRLQFGDLVFDYRWLPATPANLAKLTPHIPAGFKRVSPLR